MRLKPSESWMFFCPVDSVDWNFHPALELRLERSEFVYSLARGKLKAKCLFKVKSRLMSDISSVKHHELTIQSSLKKITGTRLT